MSRLRKRLLVGDALEQLRHLPDSSSDMVLTSPPYYRLRNYQVSGQLGLEPHVDQWVANLRSVTRELHRVLVPTGTLWLNLADTYATHPSQGGGRKSLLLAPERLAMALLADGWYLRNKIVWQKANPMPASVRDRLTCSWETIYLFTKQPGYFFALDSIRVPHAGHSTHQEKPQYRRPRRRQPWAGPNGDDASGLDLLKARGINGHPLGKNPGDVWRLSSSGFRGGHHATFPLRLARIAIQAGSPEARCISCHAPWQRSLIRGRADLAVRGPLRPSCTCRAEQEPAIVLDPFMGAGTTAVASEGLGRDWLGIELNPDFAEIAEQRIRTTRTKASKPAP